MAHIKPSPPSSSSPLQQRRRKPSPVLTPNPRPTQIYLPRAAVAMPFTPGPYSGVSTLALVARASVFGFGVVYGSIKLSILKATKPKKEEAHAHH
ncbi:ATP synthase E chain [Zea mays]|uniref:ATP synthase E chain n=1 Tax=Zea mays TaxID=4577 RepID=K7TLR2_MAIZE|nr:ATP synthase E chain [Zea mays]